MSLLNLLRMEQKHGRGNHNLHAAQHAEQQEYREENTTSACGNICAEQLTNRKRHHLHVEQLTNRLKKERLPLPWPWASGEPMDEETARLT